MSEQEKKNPEMTEEATGAAQDTQTAAKDAKSVAAKKSDKVAAKKSKPNVFARIGKWFHDLRVEAKKVVWPTRNQVINHTVVVLICIIVVCIVVTILDVTFGSIRDFIARLV
ncbi:MAG: preprotein translocase subunit SecE [Clostridiaceae bacterium]|nr:preprotein translocase subunit SecE [Clostridiaceae bacterium]